MAKFSKMIFVIVIVAIAVGLPLLKWADVMRRCHSHGSFEGEKREILERRNFLVRRLITSPQNVIDAMPKAVGIQFQGEWALYSCSMFSASLVNISHLYPETKSDNLRYIGELIDIVLSPELRYYDAMRWGEDPLETLAYSNSHISYLSHLAWMMCGFKELGGDNRYDTLLDVLCETMNRRILESPALLLPTYPYENPYIPDMLVAIVALDKYADLHDGVYRSTVEQWLERAKIDWIDEQTGLLASIVSRYGMVSGDIKGAYASLNCYYLTFVDEAFACDQYEKLKSYFWKDGFVAGLKEYADQSPLVGFDIDAGPILLGLSPSGTAFATGSATYFDDVDTRKQILRTAEIAGQTFRFRDTRHYLLANVALVGEAIMLAMRTHTKR